MNSTLVKYLFLNILSISFYLFSLSAQQKELSYPKFYSFNKLSISNATKYIANRKIQLTDGNTENFDSEAVLSIFPHEISFMSQNDVVLAYEINGITNYLNGVFNKISDENFVLTVDYPLFGSKTNRLIYNGSFSQKSIFLKGYYFSIQSIASTDYSSEAGIGYLSESHILDLLSSSNQIFSLNFNLIYQEAF